MEIEFGTLSVEIPVTRDNGLSHLGISSDVNGTVQGRIVLSEIESYRDDSTEEVGERVHLDFKSGEFLNINYSFEKFDKLFLEWRVTNNR